jgi:hypothetical protein
LDVFHYTDRDGWNGIRAQKVWLFMATQPKDPDRPVGAYFTDIPPTEENLRTLHKRIRVPRVKQQYLFWFEGAQGLVRHNHSRGRDKRIYYSPGDYAVAEERQRGQGETEAFMQVFA